MMSRTPKPEGLPASLLSCSTEAIMAVILAVRCAGDLKRLCFDDTSGRKEPN